MRQYLDTMGDVLRTGWDRPTDLKVDGQCMSRRTKFLTFMRFDLRGGGFPMVTTKPVSFRMVALELAGFIAAVSDAREFAKAGVTVWNANADSEWWIPFRKHEGDLGRIYGVEERHFPSPWSPTGEVDQLAWLIGALRANPNRSDLVLSHWNPASIQAHKTCLAPCHMFVHFVVIDGRIHFAMYQRSGDMLLGVPFNIASYVLYGMLISHITGYPLAEYVHMLGDYHIYLNHLESVEAQLKREPLKLPKLWISPDIKEIDDFRLDKMIRRIETEDDFVSGRRKPITVIDDYVQLVDYKHHPKLPGDQRMAA